MRILVITPAFPPFVDSESFCGGKFVKALLWSGVDVEVLHSMDWRLPARRDPSVLWNDLPNISWNVSTPAPWGLARRFLMAFRYRSLYWTRLADAFVESAIERHKARPFDLIMSRGLPWWSHVAGFWASTRLERPWMANQNDPWDLGPFTNRGRMDDHLVSRLNTDCWRRKTLRLARVVTFPCERLRCYSCGGNRVARTGVIPHVGFKVPVRERSAGFLLVHAGKLGTEITGRSAGTLLRGLSGLLEQRPRARESVELFLVGPEDPEARRLAQELDIAHHVRQTGSVSFEESLARIAAASVCVLVETDFKEGIFLPSKLCDYMVARKPVLALSPATGTINDMLAAGGIIRVSPTDQKGCTEALVRLYDAWHSGLLDNHAPPESVAMQFEPDRLAQQFVELAEDVLAGDRTCNRKITQPLSGSKTIESC